MEVVQSESGQNAEAQHRWEYRSRAVEADSLFYRALYWAYKPRLSVLHLVIGSCFFSFAIINSFPLQSDHCLAVERDNAALKALLHRNKKIDFAADVALRDGRSDSREAAKETLNNAENAVNAPVNKKFMEFLKPVEKSAAAEVPFSAQNDPSHSDNHAPTVGANAAPKQASGAKSGLQCTIPPDDGTVVEDITLQPMAMLGEMQVVSGANKWGVPMANSTLTIDGVSVTFDQILYGYDLIFENLAIFSRTSWFGISLQQDPADAFALQGLIWRSQPDLLIEIGTNTGGGAVFYASIMREYNSKSLVLTIDPKDPAQDWAQGAFHGCEDCIDARCADVWHTNIRFLLGFSHDVFPQVKEIAKDYKKVMVMHDGSHFYDDVLRDLKMFDDITTVGSYMVVQDTKMTRMYSEWAKNGYPLRAAEDFMKTQGRGRYKVDKRYEYSLYSQHHNGWLRKTSL
eukprot:GEMP01013790.1.p1 GENE.GEMP01013790.1~~GEMP01013790.1.p1  ORF type:complete len:457 (+),score=74.92 GEMP01013790.1:487-1857(+)